MAEFTVNTMRTLIKEERYCSQKRLIMLAANIKTAKVNRLMSDLFLYTDIQTTSIYTSYRLLKRILSDHHNTLLCVGHGALG